MKYQRAVDGKGRPIRGLWIRGKTFYTQLRDPTVGRPVRVALHDAKTVSQAVTAMHVVRSRRDQGVPCVSAKRTGLAWDEVWADYLRDPEVAARMRPGSILRARSTFKLLSKSVGGIDVGRITERTVDDFVKERLSSGVSGRTINCDLSHIRGALRWASKRGLCGDVMKSVRPLPWDARRRVELLSRDQVDSVIEACRKIGGDPLADYAAVMATLGSRCTETAHMMWDHVDFVRRQVTVRYGSDSSVVAKNGEVRVVPMNPKLESILLKMRSKSTSGMLFPKTSTGALLSELKAPRRRIFKICGLKRFGWHFLRHYFISQAVMSGVDFMTVSKWVGHKDGGALICRVYGHISDSHSSHQASRLVVI